MKRRLFSILIIAFMLSGTLIGCGVADDDKNENIAWGDLKFDHSMELQYADQFSVDFYEEGYALIEIMDSGSFVVVPEGKAIPSALPEDTAVIQQPLNNIYLVATSAMDLFVSLDGLDHVRLSGTNIAGWHIDEAKQAMEDGKILYAGKYSAPDYERIYAENCDLAIESTMIYHAPEVKEKLEQLGIPVLVERSSYESHPLGRMEWLKLYGVLLGKTDEAQKIYQLQLNSLADVLQQEHTGKTVAFFYITSNGAANVRKSGDYIAKLIDMAGGTYIFDDLTDDNALSTMNMDMESFYIGAKDADYIIYNSTIDGELHTVDELLSKSKLLKEFKAVKEGNVWCTERNLFQSTMGLGDMLLDIHTILTQPNPDPATLTYLHKLS